MSNTFKTKLKFAAITVAAAVSMTGALAILPTIANAAALNLTKNLIRGSRGAEVTDLQTALATDSTVYPEGIVSGFFGALTEKAVKRFQVKYSIVSSGTPSTTGYGRVGPKTRAKLNNVFGVVTPNPFNPNPNATTTVVAGSGLTVSTVTQPSETLAPQSAARLPFVKVMLSASNDGDVTVNSLTVQRGGLADDAIFSDVLLLDEDGTQIGIGKTFNANHILTFNQPFVVKKGTSKTVTVAGNMAATLTSYAGQVVKLLVTAVDAGSSAVSGSLPITGNGMTVNATLTISSATTVRGATDPGAANTKNVGDTNYIFSAVKITAGSQEDVLVKMIRFDQAGSAASSDLANIKVTANGTDYAVSTDGKFYWANLGDGITVAKGNSLEIAIKGDITNGSNRTVDFNVRKKTDIVILGKLYGYYITPTGGTSGAPAAGALSSDTEPFYNAFAATINSGTLLVQKSNAVTASNVAVNTNNVSLGSFLYTVRGEPIQITSMLVSFTGSTTPQITAVSVYDQNGAVVAGPKDVANGGTGVTFTDTFIVPTGDTTYTVKGKLATSFATNDAIGVSVIPSGFTARGTVTGLTITPTPSSAVAANSQTVKAAAVASSISTSPVAQNVVRGIVAYKFATIQYDATNSGEDLRITSQALTDTIAGSGVANDLNTCQVYDGTTILNDGSNVVNPVAGTIAYTFTMSNGLIVSKGTVKSVDLKCNISSSAVANSTHSWGFTATQTAAVTGMTTGNSVTPTQSLQTGQIMTLLTGGSFTVALDTSSPTERYANAGTTDNVLSVFKLHANNEALRLDKIQLSFSSSTASTTDIVKYTLWDGATKVGEGLFAGTNVTATTTLTSTLIIPKDGDKLLTVKTDLQTVGTSQPGTTGHTIAINLNGAATTSTVAVGQSSGTSFNSGTSADVNGNGVRLVKAYPTLVNLPVPTNTLANGTMVLYRFSVTAPASGDVGLTKFTFNVSSTTVGTTSAFSVYGYSDSAFSVQAYNKNPVNANAAANVGSTTQLSTQTRLFGTTAGTATNTQIAIYFDPITNSATAPNDEAINVSAGTTRYFELRGTVASATTGDAINVSLAGDSISPSATGIAGPGSTYLFAYTAQTVDQNRSNKFIWSPNTTSTAATTTTDWLNGYELPGLPSTNMQQQTFSK